MPGKYFLEHGIDINSLTSCSFQPIYRPADNYNLPLVLSSIGRSIPQNPVKVHYAGETFVNFCVDGRGELKLFGKTYDVTPGTCMIIAKGTPVEYHAVEKKYSTFWVAFTGPDSEKVFSYRNIFSPLSNTAELLDEWYKLYEIPKDFDWPIECLAPLYRFVFKLNRQIDAQFAIDLDSSRDKLHSILNYFDHFISKPYSLDDLAEAVRLSPAHICRIFKNEYNMSPNEYFEKKKIEFAKNMLISTDHSVKEIAISCGYFNANYFTFVFKKHEGVSPSQFRLMARG